MISPYWQQSQPRGDTAKNCATGACHTTLRIYNVSNSNHNLKICLWRANVTVAASVASWADYGRWAQEGLPAISISNHWNKRRRHDGYHNNMSYANAWYSGNVARRTRKRWWDLWSEGPWVGEELGHGNNTIKYKITRPLQHVGTISVEAKTSVC